MIDPILFAITMIVLGYGVCVLFAGTSKGSPSCPCGLKRLSDAYMVHSSDFERITAQLTALCPMCNCNARHNHLGTPAQPITLGDIRPEGGF